MLHIVHLLERRFPRQARRIAPLLVLVSGLSLLAGFITLYLAS